MSWRVSAFLLVVVIGIGWNQAADADQEKDVCLGQAFSRQEVGYCWQKFVEREDAKIASVWTRIEALMSGDGLSGLLDDQKRWRAYREEACQFYRVAPFPQEDQTSEYHSCKADLTTRRLQELEHIEELLLTFR